MVIDADADYRLVVRLALEGHSRLKWTAEASSLDQAQVLAGCRPNVLLVDASLITSEWTTMRTLTATLPEVAVITTSPNARPEVATHVLAGKPAGHISKGVVPSRLADEILRLAEPAIEPVLAKVEIRLPAQPESSRAARSFIESTLADWHCQSLVASARLMVSELASNAVGHARSSFGVCATLRAGSLRVEITDDSEERLRRRTSKDSDISGRGIAIVETLSRSWGVNDGAVGKTVWFELAR